MSCGSESVASQVSWQLNYTCLTKRGSREIVQSPWESKCTGKHDVEIGDKLRHILRVFERLNTNLAMLFSFKNNLNKY